MATSVFQSREKLSIMVCDHDIWATHTLCLMNQQVAALRVRVISNNLHTSQSKVQASINKILSNYVAYKISDKSRQISAYTASIQEHKSARTT